MTHLPPYIQNDNLFISLSLIAPVVVTSATHQPPGGPTYPIQTEHTTIITSSPPQQPVGMPMPYNQPSAIPYPPVAAPGFGVAP